LSGETAGLVLCGGASRRMGRGKATLPFGDGGEVLLQRVVRRLTWAVGPAVVVVAAAGQALPPLPGYVRVVRDAAPDRGPLQGLAAGLAALPDSADLVYVTAADAPFLEPAWVARLVALIGPADLALPFAEGRHHPLAALYRRGPVLPAAEVLLEAGGRLGPIALRDVVRTRVVGAEELRDADPSLRTLRNLNTPEEYRAALAECLAETRAGGGRPGTVEA